MPVVFIRKEATREVRKHVDSSPWDGDYIWADGNYSCDCNRHLFFERAAGNEPEWDSGACGDEAWHRFGNPNVVEWEDETHKAEYYDAAWEVFRIASGEGMIECNSCRHDVPAPGCKDSKWCDNNIDEADIR